MNNIRQKVSQEIQKNVITQSTDVIFTSLSNHCLMTSIKSFPKRFKSQSVLSGSRESLESRLSESIPILPKYPLIKNYLSVRLCPSLVLPSLASARYIQHRRRLTLAYGSRR